MEDGKDKSDQEVTSTYNNIDRFPALSGDFLFHFFFYVDSYPPGKI